MNYMQYNIKYRLKFCKKYLNNDQLLISYQVNQFFLYVHEEALSNSDVPESWLYVNVLTRLALKKRSDDALVSGITYRSCTRHFTCEIMDS